MADKEPLMEVFTDLRERKYNGTMGLPSARFAGFIDDCRVGIDRDDPYLVKCLDALVQMEKRFRERNVEGDVDITFDFKDGVLVEVGYQPTETK